MSDLDPDTLTAVTEAVTQMLSAIGAGMVVGLFVFITRIRR